MKTITNWPLAMAILSLSISTFVTGAAVAPALGKIANAFPGASPLAIQMVISLPAIAIIPASLGSGRLARLLGKRRLTLLGMLVYIAGGTGAALAPSMTVLLAFRMILGLGAGVLLPLSIALIADFYTGPARTRLTGYSGGVAGLGGTVITLLAGWLGNWGWRQVFGVYLVMAVPLVLCILFLKEPEAPAEEDTITKAGGILALWMNPQVIKASGLMFFITVMVFAVPLYMAIYMQDMGTGGPLEASWIMVMPNLAGIFSGLVFSDFKRVFRKQAYPAGFLLLAGGFFILGMAARLPFLIAGAFVFGAGLGLLNPLNYLRVVNAVPLEGAPLSLAVANSFMFLAQFTAPLVYSVLMASSLITTMGSVYLLNAVVSVSVALFLGVRGWVQDKQPV